MNKTLTIIIPVYNEINTIGFIFDKILNLKLVHEVNKQIIIIDDCSTDGTKEFLKNKQLDHPKIIFLFKEKNQGKGHSQKIAKEYVFGNFVIIQDADLEYDPEDINKLLKIALEQNTPFVIGYRNMKTDILHPYFLFREFAVYLLTFLMNILYSTKIKDSACCYRLFDAKLWKSISGRANRFEYDFSIICQAILKTKNVGQCSVYYNPRTYKDGKKCTWDVGFHAFKRIILDRFS